MILDYNKTKSAVDNLDKLVREYRCLRTSRRWPLTLFLDFIDIAGHNAFCAWSDHEPNYRVENLIDADFLMQLAEDLVKALIDGRTRNPVGIQEPILAAIRMFVPVEHRIARHIRPQENEVLEDVLSVLVVKTVKVVRSVTKSCNNFICREHSEKKTVIVCDDRAAPRVKQVHSKEIGS